MAKLKAYPIWICPDCGLKNGKVSTACGCYTVHNGKCDVCGVEKAVTEPRDFGYPEFEGHMRLKVDDSFIQLLKEVNNDIVSAMSIPEEMMKSNEKE